MSFQYGLSDIAMAPRRQPGESDDSYLARIITGQRYEIKCDECKRPIGRTNSLRESAEGGRCDECRAAIYGGETPLGVEMESE